MIRTETNKYSSVVEEVAEAIAGTFDVNAEKLPSRNIVAPHLKDPFSLSRSIKSSIKGIEEFDDAAFIRPFAIRDMYLEHAFVAYTDEMLAALKKFCDSKNMKVVHEVCCGTGWFAHWMRKYGIPLKKAVDNKTWHTYKRDNKFLPIVTKEDAVRFVKKSGDADMIICAWPYMNPLMNMIWNAMRPGQYLLYIGEGFGGCTADDGFFNATSGHQVEDDDDFNKIAKAFVQFSGLHDRPELYRKPIVEIEKVKTQNTKFIKRVCKHHGLTNFYDYENNKNSRCQTCTQNLRKKRYSNDSSYDKKYNNAWNKSHPNYTKAHSKEEALKKKMKKKEKFELFIKANDKIIRKMCNVLSINRFEIDLKGLFPQTKGYTQNDIKKKFVKRKRGLLLEKEIWKQSTKVKYAAGVRENYSEFSESIKAAVREQYKRDAKKIVDEKMKTMLKQL